MSKQKRKLTAAEKAAKKQRRKEYMFIFVGGKQKRVRRPPAIEGMDAEEFIRKNADPVWLHQNEMWEFLEPIDELPPNKSASTAMDQNSASPKGRHINSKRDEDIPF